MFKCSGYKYRFIFILLTLFYTWLHFCLSFSFYNQFLLCVFRSLLSLPLANHASHTVGCAILTTCALCLCLLIHYFLFLLISGIVSLLNKADFITSITSHSRLNLMALTETWIKPEDNATPAALSNNFSFSHTPPFDWKRWRYWSAHL